MIRLENFKKKYDNKILFKDINLTINKGDSVAFIGKSGSGKSTLLNIIGLIEKPSSGKLYWDDQEITINSKKSKNLIRYQIGYLFQNFALIDDKTVEENVKIAMRYLDKNIEKGPLLEEALSKVGLQKEIKQKVYTLSGGEQQRTAMARILVKPCTVILADEPTGNLDKKNSDNVMDILFELNKEGKTIVIVTHDHSYLDRFDYVYQINGDGTISTI